ncbi:MAG: recombinase family protein [Ruminococcaceae bacterium]|nr:recombinase family protein [Oscillospiraceae bacterium]
MNAIYARQSIDKKDSLSIEGQIEICRRYAGEDALVFQDRGYSGKNTKRPAFRELMQAVQEGTIETVFVYRLDRFSRSISDFSRLWETMERCNVRFNSVTEQFDTGSPIGRAMLNIVTVFAQLERETTAERVRDNYLHRFQLGAWPGGPAPYGFRLVKTVDGGRVVTSLAEDEKSDVVRRIFREYARQGTSLRSVAKALNSASIPGPKRALWDSATLSRILRSPVYVRADEDVLLHYLGKGMLFQSEAGAFDGVHACNVIGRRDRGGCRPNGAAHPRLAVSRHEGIVDSSLWLAVQSKLDGLEQIPRQMAGKHSWLTGLLKCGKCGYAVKINRSRADNKLYLICSGRSNTAGCDAAIQINVRELERQVGAQIKAILAEAPPEETLPKAPGCAERLLAIDRKIERLMSALTESGAVSAAYISAGIERLHAERESLLQASPERPAQPGSIEFEDLEFEEKKLVAAELIDRILLNGDQAEIRWKL